MSHRHLRTDKTCQNCGHEVPERFCTSCGQENTESRQSFGHLAGHFFEDLTHYEGKFWKTMLLLISRPASLTKAYLAGKRASFVPPVRLYFFISFVTFLLPHFLPEEKENRIESVTTERSKTDSITTAQKSKTIHINIPNDYESVAQMDSMERQLPVAERMSAPERWAKKKMIHIQHMKSPELREKFSSGITGNFPKALFIYLPLFAFVLWLFHGKKRWMYSDHAIFTIHYFCFMMLTISIMNVLIVPVNLMPAGDLRHSIEFMLSTSMVIWFVYYFLRAHHKMYNESWIVSSLKGTIVFILNLVIFIMLLFGLVIFTITTIY